MLITAEYLKGVGFRMDNRMKDEQERWTLWFRCGDHSQSDTGVELCESVSELPEFNFWYCFLRSDLCGRYGRFCHIRHVRRRADLENLISALAGQPFSADDVLYGQLWDPERAARYRQEENARLDIVLAQEGYGNDSGTSASG